MASTQQSKPHVVGLLGLQGAEDRFAARLSIASQHEVIRGVTTEEIIIGSDFIVCGKIADMTNWVNVLRRNATILFTSFQCLEDFESLQKQLLIAERHDVLLLDTPFSLTGASFVSGTSATIEKSNPLLGAIFNDIHVVPGDLGTASKVFVIHQLLIGVHTAAAAEAVALAQKAGLDNQSLYNIIKDAAGGSKCFAKHVPKMIQRGGARHRTVDEALQDMACIAARSRELQFPLPLASAVEQLYTLASAKGYGSQDESDVLRVYSTTGSPTASINSPSEIMDLPKPASSSIDPRKIGIIGLGSMGFGMGSSLIRAGYSVAGFDIVPSSVSRFEGLGSNSTGADTVSTAVSGADLIILMVQSASQVDNVLFGSDKAIDEVMDGALIVLSATVAPSYAAELAIKVQGLGRGIKVVDAPVSGGAARAAKGDLTFIFSDIKDNFGRLEGPLLAMAGTSANLFMIPGPVGSASSVKMINQLLAGVHIAAAAEAMALAKRWRLNLEMVYGVINGSEAWSWMFENRVVQIVQSDWTPFSALAIFVKDMGIVLSEARMLSQYAPISAVTSTLYIEGAARGLTAEADIGVYRIWPQSDTSAMY